MTGKSVERTRELFRAQLTSDARPHRDGGFIATVRLLEPKGHEYEGAYVFVRAPETARKGQKITVRNEGLDLWAILPELVK